MGAIVSKVQLDRVMSYIESAKQEGAQLISGGGPPKDPALAKGFYVEPTVFADVTHEEAHRARGDFRARARRCSDGPTRPRCSRGERGRIRPHRLDLDQ